MTELKGQTALVTGAAKRVGRAITLGLASEGMNIVVHYNRSSTDAESLKLELKEMGIDTWTLQADFSEPNGHRDLIARAIEDAGSLDILVNSASVFSTGSLDEMTIEDLEANVRVNAWVPFELSREFVRQVGRGKIVNILDTRVIDIDLAHPAYILAKKMLHEFTKMMAVEYAPDVTVNAVAPGLILPPVGRDDAYLDHLAQAIPMKRKGNPVDVVGAVVFLAKADFITGQTIFVDGGRHLKEYRDG